MTRRFLLASLAIAPVTIVLHYVAGFGDVTEFVLAAAALVPLAWLIGEATEHASEHTGPGIGGFLNATFGNAPELIIALLAIDKGLFDVVRGSLTGSVIGNLLLVLGFSLLLGGDGEIDRKSSYDALALVFLATLLFFVPAGLGWAGGASAHSIAIVSTPVSVALLLLYVAKTWVSLRGHHAAYAGADPDVESWSLRFSLGVLALATVGTAFVAEILVGSLETFADRAGFSDFFIAAIIVAVVGNAAEHGGAVVVAHRGKIKLASAIALQSSAQVAVFLVPAVALLSWLIDPLPLSFHWQEMAALGGSTLLATLLLRQGRSSRARGAVLVAAWLVVAAGFFFVGDR